MRVASVAHQVACHEWPAGHFQSIYQPPFPTTNISWCHDGSWMALLTTQSVDVVAFNEDTSTQLMHSVQKISNPSSVSFQNTSRRYMAISSPSQIYLYDIKVRTFKREYGRVADSDGSIFKVAYSPKDSFLYAGTKNGTVVVFSGAARESFKFPKGSLRTFSVHPKYENVVSGCTDSGHAFLWQVGNSAIVFEDPQLSPLLDINFSDDCLLYVTKDRRLRFVDYNSNVARAELPLEFHPVCLDTCPDNIGFAVGSAEGFIFGYDVRRLKEPVCKFLGAGNAFIGQKKPIKQVCFEKAFHKDFAAGDLYCEIRMDALDDDDNSQMIQDSNHEIKNDMFRGGQCGPSLEQEIHGISNLEIRRIVKDTIKEELNNLRSDVRKQVNEVLDTTKKNYLDLQMQLTKEFIKIEEGLSDLRSKLFYPEDVI